MDKWTGPSPIGDDTLVQENPGRYSGFARPSARTFPTTAEPETVAALTVRDNCVKPGLLHRATAAMLSQPMILSIPAQGQVPVLQMGGLEVLLFPPALGFEPVSSR